MSREIRKKGGGPKLKKLFLDTLETLGIEHKRYLKPRSKPVLYHINNIPCIIHASNSSYQTKFSDFYWGVGEDNLVEFLEHPDSLMILLGGRNFGGKAPEAVERSGGEKKSFYLDFVNETPRIEYIFLFSVDWYYDKVKNSSPDQDERRNIHILLKEHYKMTSEDITIDGGSVEEHALNRYDRLQLSENIQENLRSIFAPISSESERILDEVAEVLVKDYRLRRQKARSQGDMEEEEDEEEEEEDEEEEEEDEGEEEEDEEEEEEAKYLIPISKKKELSSTLPEENYLKIMNLLETGHQIILYGPPGTSKSFTAIEFTKKYVKYDTNYVLIQFHPSYSYEDFVEGISPVENDDGVKYKIEKRIFRELAERANRFKEEKFILIIDEINRGDISKIFGELILGLESEYRGTPVHTLYFSEPLVIPENLYIIGTMNSVDHSIISLDQAISRRFLFLQMYPSEAILKDWLEQNGTNDNYIEKVMNLFARTNEKILEFKNNDKDSQIGHTYFFKTSENALEVTWQHSIIPLIERLLRFDSSKLEIFNVIYGEIFHNE